MPRALLDENISLQVGGRLRAFGYEVVAITQHPQRGMSDEAVFALATAARDLLITRDVHFTNPIRFPPAQTSGILYVTAGNLRGREEADLIERFLKTHTPDAFDGRLVILTITGASIR